MQTTSVYLRLALLDELDAVVDVLRCALNCALATQDDDTLTPDQVRLNLAMGRLSIGLVTRLVEEAT